MKPKFISRILPARILFILLFLSAYHSKAQSSLFLEVPVKMDIEKGGYDDVIVKVQKDGKDAFTQSGSGKMRFKLDFNKKYTLIFTKPGYVTKKIEINTAAPADRIQKGFEPYKIGIKLFQQGDKENVVVYNQAVAKIQFDKNLDEFGFATDYSKSILNAFKADDTDSASTTPSTASAKSNEGQESTPGGNAKVQGSSENAPEITTASTNSGADKEEKTSKRHRKNKPEKEQVAALPIGGDQDPPPASSPSSGQDNGTPPNGQSGQENNSTASTQSGIDLNTSGNANTGSEKSESMKPKSGSEKKNKHKEPVSGEEKKVARSPIKTGEEHNSPKLAVQSGSDVAESIAEHPEDEKINREDLVEKNRIITRVTVTHGDKTTVYQRVSYAWGGEYYFKNLNTSISQTSFALETGVKN